MVKRVGFLFSVLTWLLVATSVVILTGGVFHRPLLLAAVPTGSMAPTLNPGDMIIVLPTWAVPPLTEGDIVVFKTPRDREWIVHRIIGGDAFSGYVTKGDANPTADVNSVRQNHIAGIVPRWNGQAARLPRLGVLSLDKGPLSSPVVAAVALVMGIFLLVLDLPERQSAPRGRAQPQGRTRPGMVLQLYIGFATTVFLTTLIPAWTMSSSMEMRYQFVDQHHANVKSAGLFLTGRPHQESAPFENPSFLPLLVVYSPEDPFIHYDPWWSVVPPKQTREFHVTVQAQEPGRYTSYVRSGAFLPLMPPYLLAHLARISVPVAAIVNALVPTLVILVIALIDVRTRIAINRIRLRLEAWLAA
jgi:signal peptidase I